jgi:hypothetical protein
MGVKWNAMRFKRAFLLVCFMKKRGEMEFKQTLLASSDLLHIM